MTLAIILFVLTYVLMFTIPKKRPIIALCSALIFIVTGIIGIKEAFFSIDFNVLLMIGGTMGTVALVIDSGMPNLLSDIIIEKVPNVKWAIIILSLFAGVVSAFIDNVATVLMIAPVALAIAKRLKISPVSMIIAISVSSNLQGAATLVGDTTSILLGGYAGMSFNDFFWYKSKPGIFFAVELGAVVSAIILYFIFRKENSPVEAGKRTEVKNYFPSYMLLLTVLLLIAASFFPNRPSLTNGIICTVLMIVCAVQNYFRTKTLKGFTRAFTEIDFETCLLLLGLFIVVGGITAAGVVDAIARLFAKVGNGNVFLIYTIVVWASVIISAFIDNIPYVATMLPVMQGLASEMGLDPTVLYFGLLIGATLGGNLTPVGASANITGIGMLRKEGCEVRNTDFMKIGVPFTLAAVVTGYLFVWFFYGV